LCLILTGAWERTRCWIYASLNVVWNHPFQTQNPHVGPNQDITQSLCELMEKDSPGNPEPWQDLIP
jgi:hypothetical protein